jgi:hypothetical protein
VRNADAGLEARGVGPQGCGAAAGPLGKRASGRIERGLSGTHLSVHAKRGARWTKPEKPYGFRHEEAAKGQTRRRETFG